MVPKILIPLPSLCCGHPPKEKKKLLNFETSPPSKIMRFLFCAKREENVFEEEGLGHSIPKGRLVGREGLTISCRRGAKTQAGRRVERG